MGGRGGSSCSLVFIPSILPSPDATISLSELPTPTMTGSVSLSLSLAILVLLSVVPTTAVFTTSLLNFASFDLLVLLTEVAVIDATRGFGGIVGSLTISSSSSTGRGCG